MDHLIRAFPILPGKVDAFRAFAEELCNRRKEADAFYASYGIVRESWHLQDLAGAPYLICCTDIEDVGSAAPVYAAAASPFEIWFKRQVLELTGVDANQQPKGPPSEPLFEWSAQKSARMAAPPPFDAPKLREPRAAQAPDQ
jgi:hypothetical protein